MNYEDKKKMILNDDYASNKLKAAIVAFDDMDCVKARNIAQTLFALMEKRCSEVQQELSVLRA